MKDEHFGVCHVRNNAFSSSLAGTSAALPPDYTEPFATRVRASDCCAVMTRGANRVRCKPRRCENKRRLWNPNQPEKACETCVSHAKLEGKARAWMAAQQR